MTDKRVEETLDTLIGKMTPDYETCMGSQARASSRGRKRRKHSLLLRVGSLAAALLLVCVGVGGYAMIGAVDFTVTLDVNPSIEILANRLDRVLDVRALNEDGEAVLDGMQLRHVDIDVAVNALIGSMVRQGYLSELSNSILITVDGTNASRNLSVSDHISTEVESLLNLDFSGAVLSQTASKDQALKTLAEDHHITVGKAQLIQTILDAHPAYDFDALSGLTINELNVLLGKLTNGEGIHSAGNASTRAYIGEEQALAIACAYLEVEPEAVTLTEPIHLDLEDGRLVYEIEFLHEGVEYDFDVDALTGEIVKVERESNKQPNAAATAAPKSDKKTESKSTSKTEKSEQPKATPKSTKSDGSKSTSKSTKSSGSKATSKSTKSEEYIGESKAKEIALKHAGVSKSDARKLRCEKDRENGRVVYEVEFKANGYEYEYEIDALTGKILKHEKERDD